MIALLALAALVQGAPADPPTTVRIVGAARSAVIAVVRLDGQPAVYQRRRARSPLQVGAPTHARAKVSGSRAVQGRLFGQRCRGSGAH